MRNLSTKEYNYERHVRFDLLERNNRDSTIFPHQIKFARWRAVANQLKKHDPKVQAFLKDDDVLQSVCLKQYLGSLLHVDLVFSS